MVTGGGHNLRPAAEYFASLPRRRVGSGLLITNPQGDILLLETTNKPGWKIPGGFADAGESPLMSAAREVTEELGLTISPGSLLVVDHVAEQLPAGDIIAFVYDGGLISDATSIVLDQTEIRKAHFVPLADVRNFVTPNIAKRLRAAICARNERRLVEIGSDLDDKPRLFTSSNH